jgi:chemotaxis methyl-accepting protein methylase
VDPELAKLQNKIYDVLGFKADRYEIKHLKRRIQSRIRVTDTKDFKKYLEYLNSNNDEVEKLKAVLTVNVTEFFRNPEVYQALHDKILPNFLESRSISHLAPLRIWSLGCSTGEEPYSIAMSVSSVLNGNPQRSNFRIYATDIDDEALKIAKLGEYSDDSKIPPDFVKRYTEKLDGEKFTFKKEITNKITFFKHNIFSDPPLKNIDILVCRNTIIYFNTESKKDLYHLFNDSLVMGGFLILGKAESFISHRAYGFVVEESKSHIFKKVKKI